jgi:antitoxin MazE
LSLDLAVFRVHPMKTTIKKWGNSAAVRLPSKILAAAHIDMNTLLRKITPKNCHHEIDTGEPTGEEAW